MLKKAKGASPKTYIAIVLDESSSMSSIRNAAVTAFNKIVDSIKKEANASGQETYLTFVKFNGFVHPQYDNKEVELVPTLHSIYPNGSTALFDGVGLTSEKLEKIKLGKKDAVLVIAITDGEENSSVKYEQHNGKIQELMRRLGATDQWTFTYQVPKGTKDSFCRNFSIPEGNVAEWEQTDIGTEEMGVHTMTALSGYYTSRKLGHTSTDKFYVDLHNMKSSTVKKELDDISNQFKLLQVDKQGPIKEFVERKTKRPYSLGTTFYQLVKTEKIQAGKDVLIMEKDKLAVWGGWEARDLIGLPQGVDAKVVPANLGKYEIYVKSTSVNRKLEKNSKVLVRK